MQLDLESSEEKVPREFLAVLLAGYGNSLSPLTNNHGEDPSPKALLPIGDRPMISFTLTWLEESGVHDVLIICPASHKKAISHYLHSYPTSEAHSSMHIEFQTHDLPPELSSGTCSLLRQFSHRITGDFILISCDFVPPSSLKLSTVLNKFRVESTTDGSILTSLWYEHKPPEKEKSAVDDTWPSPAEPVPIVFDDKTGTLLHVDIPDDIDRNAEEIELRMSMLWNYPRTKLCANVMDSHVYVCKHVVLDFVGQKPHLDSFREEFLPWLCKVHFERKKREKYVPNVTLNSKMINGVVLNYSSVHVGARAYFEPNLSIPTSPTIYSQKSGSLRAGLDTADSDKTIVHKSDSDKAESGVPRSISSTGHGTKFSLRCGIVLHRFTDGYAARANNIWTYLDLNRNVLRDHPHHTEDLNLDIDSKASLSADSIIGQSTKVGERSSIKRSVIGRHCIIGKNVKIVGCVLLDHCTIEDGAKVEGSILGASTHVHAKGELIRCITQAGFEVEEGSVYKHEKLELSDWVTEPQVDISDSENSVHATDSSLSLID